MKNGFQDHIQALEYFYRLPSQKISNARIKQYLLFHQYSEKSVAYQALKNRYSCFSKSVFSEIEYLTAPGNRILEELSRVLFHQKLNGMRRWSYLKSIQKFQLWLLFQYNLGLEDFHHDHILQYLHFIDNTGDIKEGELFLTAIYTFSRQILHKKIPFHMNWSPSKEVEALTYSQLYNFFYHLPNLHWRRIFLVWYHGAMSRFSFINFSKWIYCSENIVVVPPFSLKILLPEQATYFLEKIKRPVFIREPDEIFTAVSKSARQSYSAVGFLKAARLHRKQRYFLKNFHKTLEIMAGIILLVIV